MTIPEEMHRKRMRRSFFWLKKFEAG